MWPQETGIDMRIIWLARAYHFSHDHCYFVCFIEHVSVKSSSGNDGMYTSNVASLHLCGKLYQHDSNLKEF